MVEEFIVDRIEGEYLLVENQDGEIINISLNEVIGNIREGSILIKKDNKYIYDMKKTEDRKNKINNLMKGMWE